MTPAQAGMVLVVAAGLMILPDSNECHVDVCVMDVDFSYLPKSGSGSIAVLIDLWSITKTELVTKIGFTYIKNQNETRQKSLARIPALAFYTYYARFLLIFLTSC